MDHWCVDVLQLSRTAMMTNLVYTALLNPAAKVWGLGTLTGAGTCSSSRAKDIAGPNVQKACNIQMQPKPNLSH